MKNVRYIFPKTENFREERPNICWEHMYGWLEGYGMLFDPVVFALTHSIPEWENGWNGDKEDNDFFITSCKQASGLFDSLKSPGLYIRPSTGVEVEEFDRKSEKEKLTTPNREFYYPFNLPFDRYHGDAPDWRIGEVPAIQKCGASTGVAFELFAMFSCFRNEMPEVYLTRGAEVIAALLEECGLNTSDKIEDDMNDFRIDCQAYGINRLLIQWFLEIRGESREQVATADSFFLKAMNAFLQFEKTETKQFLQKAFEQLADIRKKHSNLELHFLEYPHLGILFADKGFFELEWPEYSRKMLLSYLDQIEQQGYKVSLEAGASCWKNLTKRYPGLGEKLKKSWQEGAIELTNGTFSLPYALMSPLSLQYWQFKTGTDTFQEVFGISPQTYQCQENSLTPQMPELLKHFGYKRALHITQNHGEAPPEMADFIKWQSPAGHEITAMTAPNPTLTRKGVNYFLDLPLIHHQYGHTLKNLNYINFQDLGYVPFRVQMIRAHKHAHVWGNFELSEKIFTGLTGSELERKSYTADSYKFSEKFFYPNETNVNALSHYELLYQLVATRRQLLLAAFNTGKLTDLYRQINDSIESLCLIEAHDCCYVNGQRRGEFHSSNSNDTPPYSRETLTRKIAEIANQIRVNYSDVIRKITPETTDSLYNAAEVPLSFSKVNSHELHSGNGLCKIGEDYYAAGIFEPFATSQPTDSLNHSLQNWVVSVAPDGSIEIKYHEKVISCIPIDKKTGRFSLLSSEHSTFGKLNIYQFIYQLENDMIQTVVLRVIFTPDSDYAEISLKYAPRNDFCTTDKWNDYLALEFKLHSSIEQVQRFNPNTTSSTSENQLASPYFVAVETSDELLSLINEGTPLYEFDRKNGKINWLFHVACENSYKRRMGIVFGKNDVFQLSRAWGQGLLSVNKAVDTFLNHNDWSQISIEDFVTPETMLISNLKNDTIQKQVPQDIQSMENLVGEKITDDSCFKLKPFETGLINLM